MSFASMIPDPEGYSFKLKFDSPQPCHYIAGGPMCHSSLQSSPNEQHMSDTASLQDIRTILPAVSGRTYFSTFLTWSGLRAPVS